MDAENIEIKIAPASIFADVINKKNYYRGPLLKIPGNETSYIYFVRDPAGLLHDPHTAKRQDHRVAVCR